MQLMQTMSQSNVDAKAGRMHTVNEATFKVGRIIQWLNFELLIRDVQTTMQAHYPTPRSSRLSFNAAEKGLRMDWSLDGVLRELAVLHRSPPTAVTPTLGA